VAGNTAARAAGEVLAKLGSLVFYVVMARRLGATDYGAFVFALALTSSLLIASGFGTDDLVARQVARDKASAGAHLADVTALKAVTSLGLIAVAMVVVEIGGYPPETQLATLIIGLGAALEVGAKSWQSIFQAHERLELVSACLIVQRLLTAVVGVTILVAGGGLIGASVAYLVGALGGIVAVELALRRFTPVTRPRPTATGAWSLLRTGVPIGVAGLLLVVLLRVDVVLLSFLGDNRQVGLYAAGYRLVDGLQFLSWSFGAAMLPWLARAAAGDALTRAFMLGVKLVAAVLLPVGLTLSCFAGPIVELLYGRGFAGAAAPLTLLGGTVVCYGLQRFGATVLIARDAAGTLMRVAAVVAVFNIVANLVAIPLAAARGAAAVALGTGLLLAGLNVHFASRRTGGLRPVRALGAPAVAGLAMVGVALTLPLPALAAAAISLAVYGIVLGGIELALHRDDLRTYARALPAPLRLRLAPR
jgi:O-antigen/teichoic acid export membrane protein